MRVAIIGSRNCKDLTVADIVSNLPKNCIEILSGGAEGVDSLAKEAAQLLQVKYSEFLPQYNKYGKSATHLRNGQIIDGADLVLAFWDMNSRGSADTIAQCLEKNKPIKIINLNKFQKEKA